MEGSPYTSQWADHFSPQNCPFPWEDLNSHLIHSSLSPPETRTQMAPRSVQPLLQSLWPTDRPCYTWSVTTGRICVHSIVMQPKISCKWCSLRPINWQFWSFEGSRTCHCLYIICFYTAAWRHTTVHSAALRLHPVTHIILFISFPVEGRRLRWPEWPAC